jgi:uncharacterized membrane protein (UPF0136 family)
MSHHLAFTLGTVSIMGGTFGFFKKQSLPSLLGGIVIGSLFLSSSFLISKNKDYGVELALGTSMLTSTIMVRRAVRTRQLVPVGMVTIGMVGCGYYGYKMKQQINGI